LRAKLETVVEVVARRAGQRPPQPEPRLAEAARLILEATSIDSRPSSELVDAALRLAGLIEPPPHLLLAAMTEGGDEAALLRELEAQLPRAITDGRWARLGVASQLRGGRVEVLVALQESNLELAPVPRALPREGAAELTGELHAPFERPAGYVTAPGGGVTRLALGHERRRFSGRFRCGAAPGRYQVEITGENRFGPTVVANFPLYCGLPAPVRLEVSSVPEGPAPEDAASAEREVLRLLNLDRARAGLTALAPSVRLSRIARSHSADMRATGFVGHVSPSTGSAADRLRAASVEVALALENVARAYGPAEAERGLMESPGHRANILSTEATEVGIGVAFGDEMGGGRELFVTQLFTRPLEGAGSASLERIWRGLDDARREAQLPRLERHPGLIRIAERAAEALARGSSDEERQRQIGAELGQAAPGLSVTIVEASAGTSAELAAALAGRPALRTAVSAGMGLVSARRGGRSALWVVALLGGR
jgi:uncharacterized protein YkwD